MMVQCALRMTFAGSAADRMNDSGTLRPLSRPWRSAAPPRSDDWTSAGTADGACRRVCCCTGYRSFGRIMIPDRRDDGAMRPKDDIRGECGRPDERFWHTPAPLPTLAVRCAP